METLIQAQRPFTETDHPVVLTGSRPRIVWLFLFWALAMLDYVITPDKKGSPMPIPEAVFLLFEYKDWQVGTSQDSPLVLLP